MSSEVTLAEVGLIHSYRSVAHAPERATIIRRYAEITHLSLGRAEDALDLWVHLLETALGTAFIWTDDIVLKQCPDSDDSPNSQALWS